MIEVALHSYHDKYGSFPPAYILDETGRRMHSWRVLILEFIDPTLFKKYDFDEPWDGPRNKALSINMPDCFACPNDAHGTRSDCTSFVAVIGLGTMFQGPGRVSLKTSTGDTRGNVLFVETRNSGINWMEPRDLEVTTMSFRINDVKSIASFDPAGPIVCRVGRPKDRLSVATPEAAIKALVGVAE